MFKRFLLLFFSGILIYTFLAQGEVPSCQRTYRMLVHDFQSSSGDGPLVRLTKLLGSALEEDTGCRINYQRSSVLRGFRDMKSHRADMFAPMTQADEWGKVSVLIPLWKAQRVLLVKKMGSDLRSVTQILSDKDYRIGVQTGIDFFLRPEEIQRLREEKRIVDGATLNSMVNLLKAGKVDGFFVPPTVLEVIEAKIGESVRYQLIGDSSFQMNVGIYVSKTRLNKKEITRLSEAAARLKKNGTVRSAFQSILKPHLLKYYSL